MSKFLHIKGRVDANDIVHVLGRGMVPVAGLPCPRTKDNRIHPHVTRFLLDTGKKVSVFHVKPIYYENLIGEWRPMSEVASHYGNHRIVLKPEWGRLMRPRYLDWLIKRMALIGGDVFIPSPIQVGEMIRLDAHTVSFTESTFYPDPHTETSTVDGRIWYAGSDWADTLAGTTGDGASDSDTVQGLEATLASLTLIRGFFLFDTSTIGTDTVSAAVLSLNISIASNDVDSDSFVITASNPASNTALVVGDYDAVSATKLSSAVALSAMSAGYEDFTFNATGEGTIDGSGVSKYAGRFEDKDVDGGTPTGKNRLVLYFADQTGTTNDPKLVVTHAGGNVTVTPSTQVVASSIPAYSVAAAAVVTANTQSAAFSVVTSTIKTGLTYVANTLSAAFSIPTYAVLTLDTLVTAATQVVNVVVPAYTVTAQAVVTVVAGTVSATFSVVSHTVSAARNAIVSAATQVLTFSVVTLQKVGSVWRRSGRQNSGSDWTRSDRNSN